MCIGRGGLQSRFPGANIILLAQSTEHDALDVSQEEAGMTADVTAFFHDGTYTIAYVVSEPEGEHCAIVDSVLDYDPVSGRTTTDSADILIGFLKQ